MVPPLPTSMIQNNLPIFKSTNYQLQILITSAKAFLPWNVIYLQAPGLRVEIFGGPFCLPSPKFPLLSGRSRIYCAQGKPFVLKNAFYLLDQALEFTSHLDSLIWPIVLPGAQISLRHKHLFEKLILGSIAVSCLPRCLLRGWRCATIAQHSKNWLLQKYPLCSELVSTMPCPMHRITGTSNCQNHTSASILSPLWPPKRLSLAMQLVTEEYEQQWAITLWVTCVRHKSGPARFSVGNPVNVFNEIRFCNL